MVNKLKRTESDMAPEIAPEHLPLIQELEDWANKASEAGITLLVGACPQKRAESIAEGDILFTMTYGVVHKLATLSKALEAEVLRSAMKALIETSSKREH